MNNHDEFTLHEIGEYLAVARNLVYWNEEAAEKTKDAIERLGTVLSRLKKD